MGQLDCRLLEAVCDLLFADWDPIGINDIAPRDEYDSYAVPVIRAVLEGRDPESVADLLDHFADVNMGLSYTDRIHSRQIVGRLILLVTSWPMSDRQARDK